jgi:ribonuclease VapC
VSSKAYVLDASALLCLLNQEPGAAAVGAVMAGAKISAVNLIEVISKLIDKGLDGGTIVSDLSELDIVVMDLDRRQAERAALLRLETRGQGLSLGDRACLALAYETGSIALTGDRAWATLKLDIEVELFR